MDLLVFCAIAVALAIWVHLKIGSSLVATFVSGLGASVIYQVLVTIRLGPIDKFAPVALVSAGVIGFLISSVVGGVLASVR